MDFLRRLATLEAPLEGWTEAALEAYGRRQQQEHQLQQHQHQQQQPHLPSQDVATALLFSSPAPTAAPAATHPPAALTVQPPPMPLAFLLDAGALTTGPATASTVSLSPEASLTAASVAAAAAAAARARGHGGARSRVGLTVELPRDGDDIVDGAEVISVDGIDGGSRVGGRVVGCLPGRFAMTIDINQLYTTHPHTTTQNRRAWRATSPPWPPQASTPAPPPPPSPRPPRWPPPPSLGRMGATAGRTTTGPTTFSPRLRPGE